MISKFVLIIGALNFVLTIPLPDVNKSVQCGNIKITPYPLTNISSILGNYYDLDITHDGKPKICARSNYSMHGANIFSKNTELHILNDVIIPVVGNGELTGPGTFHMALNLGGLDTINMIFYLVATDEKSYIVVLTCMKGKPWIVVETKSPSAAVYKEALNALKKLNIPTNLVSTVVNNC